MAQKLSLDPPRQAGPLVVRAISARRCAGRRVGTAQVFAASKAPLVILVFGPSGPLAAFDPDGRLLELETVLRRYGALLDGGGEGEGASAPS